MIRLISEFLHISSGWVLHSQIILFKLKSFEIFLSGREGQCFFFLLFKEIANDQTRKHLNPEFRGHTGQC